MNNKSKTSQVKIAIVSKKISGQLLNFINKSGKIFNINTFSSLASFLPAKRHSVFSLIFLDAAIFTNNTQNYFQNECCSQLVLIIDSKQISQLKNLHLPQRTQFLLKPVRKKDLDFFCNFQITKSDLNFNKTNPDLTERLKIAIESMGIEIFEWNFEDGHLWNKSSEHHSQPTLSQFQNKFKNWIQKIHPQDLPRIKKEFDLALAGEKPFDTEYRIIIPTGEINYFRGIGALINDEQNNPVKMVGLNYNITSQKKAQLELKKIQINLKESMKFAHLGSWKINLETNETWWSDEFYRICGFEPGTIVPDSLKIYQLVHKDDLKKVVKLVKTTIASGKPGNMELRLLLPDHTQRKVHLLTKTTLENDTPYLTGFFQDITRRGEAEKKFEIAFRSSPSWIIISEIETGMMLDVNETFLQETGYEKDEVIGKTSLELGLWRNTSERNKLKEALNPSGSLKNFETRLFDKNNTLHHLLYSGEIVRISGRRVLLSVLLDISKQKKMEQSLLKARKMESIGKMAAGIAHDFNNLLQIINGYSQLLLEKADNNSRQFKDLKEINRAGKRASNLVNLLLLFSTKAHKINEQLNLNQEISSVLAYYKDKFKNFISIKFKPADNLLITRLDSDHFRILLKNLLDNSENAIKDKGIKAGTIIISTQNCTIKDQDNNTAIPAVQLSFQDNGCGMDSKTLSHIYDPYFSSKNFDRSGLGLSAIHGIVKSHQGTISCQSTLGKGTTFTIKFPAHTEQPQTENS